MLNRDFTIQLYSTKRLRNKDSGEYENLRVYTLLTSFVNGESNPGGTYDENLSKKNNSQYSLTFSISKIVEGQINPIFNMIVENRRLRLTTSDYIIDFIITAITPQVSKNNIIYNVTCQDVFSYDWTRQNIKISYDSLEEHNTALYISQHANHILEKSKFGWKDKNNVNCGLYMIDPSLEDNIIADFPNLLTTYMIQYTERTYSTLKLENVTPYAAMIELADKYGAVLDITYPYANKNKNNKLTIINFKNQQMKKFKGLYVRPEVNLSNFSISRKTDNFCSILRVSGGEDADGNIVSLMPEMPYEIESFIINNNEWKGKYIEQLKNIFYEYYKDDIGVQTNIDISNYFNILENVVKSGGNILYNFDYYYNAGLMQKNVLKELNNIFSIQLRDANLLTSAYSRQYNRLYSELMLLETEVEDYISNIAAEEEYQEELLGGKSSSGLNGTELENYNNSCNAIKDIEFTEDDNITSLNKIWKRDENDNYSIYVRNSELLYGKYALNNKIVELEQKKEELEKEYIEYIEQAKKLEKKYTKKDGTVDWTEIKDESSFSADYLNSDYVNYCYYISLAEKLYSAIGPLEYNEITKRGYYQVFIDEIEKLINYYYKDNKKEHVNFEGNHRVIGIDDSSTLITNLLSAAEKERDNLWKTIYNEYGDYISEASYSDTNQLSEDALYLVAQKEFASRCNPSIDYSSTVIDLHKILNVSNSKIDLGDIIYFYNKDLYNEYNGNLVIEVPNLKSAVQVEVEIMGDNNSNKIYPIANTLFNNDILTIKIAIDEQEKANEIIFSPTKIKVDGEEVIVLNKYLDMRSKPIQLQITGITKKLREITTQLTVSTNKMIENLLGKILRKTN